eukprot:CAMPEP_0172483954 /NCGR_PEP_ID=MMETSP1066-20121228/11197_1 /TAXON_ID=671091 /ORGANISM="Coscinodiscus wailesii, Strain CCMP2513" /LENGTH=186 /DNA_ID=CAMNT_0013248167 /DNA_START=330 /DNA_END=890 /DNA_ORIENTATION=-
MEKDVYLKAREKLDVKTVADAVATAEIDETSHVQIAFAAGLIASATTYWLCHNLYLSSIVFVVAAIAALGDPTEEAGISGAVARLVGRSTLKTMRVSQPKLSSVARAALVDVNDEMESLRSRVRALESENATLRRELAKRDGARELERQHSLDDLRRMARERGVYVTGSKKDLVRRLLDHGVDVGV